ncbi:MAG: triose-phosphate isomerase [Sandaracinaceae bacterium]|nr:triose-phosphate isomerase [Sandaracinaceae bacterium]
MSRKTVIVANFKLNLLAEEAKNYTLELIEALRSEPSETTVVIAPVYTAIPAVSGALDGAHIALAAQDIAAQVSGAFTGEVSAPFLLEFGCRYVIVGHSERRRLFGENDEIVAKKARAAVDGGLIPIVCVGETLEERERGEAESVVETQLRAVLDHCPEGSEIVTAYEPVWAIGTGKTASVEDAEKMHRFIRTVLGSERGDNTSILYGGSVNADTAPALLSSADIDGALVGGASLKVASFLPIIRAAAK